MLSTTGRPTALIGSPTLISASLFAIRAFMPAWAAAGLGPATALSFGLVSGYLAYGLTHHATHHAVPGLGRNNAWLARRRRWHALHHAACACTAPLGHCGVSSGLWDPVFSTEHVRKTRTTLASDDIAQACGGRAPTGPRPLKVVSACGRSLGAEQGQLIDQLPHGGVGGLRATIRVGAG